MLGTEAGAVPGAGPGAGPGGKDEPERAGSVHDLLAEREVWMVLGPHKKKADAKIDADAARASQAQERADRQAEEDAEREAAHLAGPVAQKKERGRSENLDPEIEA